MPILDHFTDIFFNWSLSLPYDYYHSWEGSPHQKLKKKKFLLKWFLGHFKESCKKENWVWKKSQKKILVDIFLGWKNVWAEKFLLVKKKFWVQKNFLSKNFLVENIFLSKNFFVQKIFGQKIFLFKKFLVEKFFCIKNFWSKNFFV